jgi:hypothetical protein
MLFVCVVRGRGELVCLVHWFVEEVKGYGGLNYTFYFNCGLGFLVLVLCVVRVFGM